MQQKHSHNGSQYFDSLEPFTVGDHSFRAISKFEYKGLSIVDNFEEMEVDTNEYEIMKKKFTK